MTRLRVREQGVALAIVVWFIAGMSLLVAGIVAHARVDTGMTQIHLGRAKAVAAGDGAIQLAMLAMHVGANSSGTGSLPRESTYEVGKLPVVVRVYPATGFIDVNEAPAELLSALFAFTGKVTASEAKSIADNVVKWRVPSGPGKRRALQPRRFQSLEDLLRVEGFTRGLLDAVREYAVAGDWVRGAMDWSAAPEAAIGVLEKLNPGQVDAVLQRRESLAYSEGGKNRRALGTGSKVYRVDALISYGGRTWLRRRWLTSGSGGSGSDLPWRVLRTEPPRVVEG